MTADATRRNRLRLPIRHNFRNFPPNTKFPESLQPYIAYLQQLHNNGSPIGLPQHT